jgi:protein SCO1/2
MSEPDHDGGSAPEPPLRADPQRAAPSGASLRAQVFAAIGAALQKRVAALVSRPSFWVLAIGLVFILPIGRALGQKAPRPPEMRLALPAFQLTDHHGRPYGSADLKGRVWVADFVFTSCPTVCPKLTKRMATIQHRARHMGDAFHLVTFTVDPENDTPEKLATYAKAYRASGARWSFLTGNLSDIESTVVKGFKMAMGKEELAPGTGLFSVFHGEKFVLVDREGYIRGYYDADDEGIDALMRDAGLVANAR